MPAKKTMAVSPAELDVLRMLWDGQPATLGELHEKLGERFAYTTLQTMLDRLVEKGIVARDRRTRPARHRAKLSRKEVMRHYVAKIFDRPAPLVLQLLRDEKFSRAEIAEIKRLIEQAEHSAKEERS